MLAIQRIAVHCAQLPLKGIVKEIIKQVFTKKYRQHTSFLHSIESLFANRRAFFSFRPSSLVRFYYSSMC